MRILTDLHISQIPWWGERLALVPPPAGRGLKATITGAFRTVYGARGYDAFISANVRNALALGLFKRLTGRRRPLLVLTEMRLDDPRPGLQWRVKVALQRFAWAAADAMCVSARQEADLYADRLHVSRDRFRFIPWHTNILEPRWCPPAGDYLLAAGRTGRDWLTLAKAVAALPANVTVVCSRSDAERVAFPPNVTVLSDVPYAHYRELLQGARLVLVPLEPHVFSSGQVVILEAMALGKPVIATRLLGTEDYIQDGMNGVLVEPRSAADLRAAIVRVMSTPGMADRLGHAAVEIVNRRHTLEGYVRNVLGVVEDVAARAALAR